ncbi:MAG TPA: hypothetical protein VGB88_14970 [Alphaproteobacteria bacterium]
MTAKVYIAHCIDTEGPLYESLDARFERLSELFAIDDLPRTAETLRKLRDKEIALGGIEEAVALTLSSHRNAYLESWHQVDAMLERVTAPAFRDRLPDSAGNGWVFTWFCLDHVGYDYNPRRRDIGFHNVFDHYARRLAAAPGCPDELQWHFHPMSTYGDAHRCATHYFRTDHVFQVLCRKVIERAWFPSTFRAGFQAERPDSHWFLEQWIPFDISSMALDDNRALDDTIDFRNGRSGDWRLAPADWGIYHPSHDDYQRPGGCRRWIGRALNVMNRIGNLDQGEMDMAFARADAGRPALVGVASHDFRDLGPEIDHVRAMIAESRRRFPTVAFEYVRASDGFRRMIGAPADGAEPLALDLAFHPADRSDVARIEVRTAAGEVFGPQPFLALETRSRRFIHDNFDFSPCRRRWHYAFHADTLPIEDVLRVGVAANDRFGRTCIRRLEFQSDRARPVAVLDAAAA